jgi:multiple sugar transport system substrate-binding protein
MLRRTIGCGLLATAAILAACGWAPRALAEDTTLTVWSHEADEPAKVAFRELAARNLEKSHPGVHVKITWYEKNGLYTALKTALPAGQGPDVFYLEPDQTEYITKGMTAGAVR